MMCLFNNNLDSALFYASLGYSVFPLQSGKKEPLPGSRGATEATTDKAKIRAWFDGKPDLNVGISSSGLLIIDIDKGGVNWKSKPEEAWKINSLAKFPACSTPNGGYHIYMKLPEGVAWKSSVKRLAEGIDTRVGTGSYCVAPPSVLIKEDGDEIEYTWMPGRELNQHIEELSEPLSWLCKELDALHPRIKDERGLEGQSEASSSGGRLIYEQSEIQEGGRNDRLFRLGCAYRREGRSLDWIKQVLLVENKERCKPPLSAGEVVSIAKKAYKYEPDPIAETWAEMKTGLDDVNLGELMEPGAPTTKERANRANEGHESEGKANNSKESQERKASKPKEAAKTEAPSIPLELMRIPGFVSDVMDYTLANSAYPNQAMAFAGALALQAFLAGRKVCEPSGLRTNLYIIALAHSGAGKEAPRSTNAAIISALGLEKQLGSSFASGEGLQDALFLQPCMLFQTDEIDNILQAMSSDKEARYSSLMQNLLNFYSSAQVDVTMRKKAVSHIKSEKDRLEAANAPAFVIKQPCLVLYGTAIPAHFNAAMGDKMASNGLFSRFLIVESGKRGKASHFTKTEIPDSVMSVADYWSAYSYKSTGNLVNEFVKPDVVPMSPEASELMCAAQETFDAEYDALYGSDQEGIMSAWARAGENMKKLALIYAVSKNHYDPEIDLEAMQWAGNFIYHSVMVSVYNYTQARERTKYDDECRRFIKILERQPGRKMTHSAAMLKLRIDAKAFATLVATMFERGQLRAEKVAGKTKPQMVYELVDE